jgi:hypothetical protein
MSMTRLHPPHRLLLLAICLLPPLAGAQESVKSLRGCFAYASVQSLPLQIEQYADTPYYFLERGDLKFTIDIEPRDCYALDLLWGAKQDQRSAAVVVNGSTQIVTAGGYDGFQWVRVGLPPAGQSQQYEVRLSAAGPGKTAFLSAIRIVATDTPLDAPVETPGETKNVTFVLPEMQDGWPAVASYADRPALERNALQAARALAQSHRFVTGWLAKVDPVSGLIPENLTRGIDRWNGRNNAADNYPFMVLTAALTDRQLFEGQLLEMLQTEQRLTNRVDRLGDVYRFSTRGFEYEEVDLQRIIFDNSEYVKDGLMPLTEWLGHSPWSERMSGIIQDIWKHAPVQTAAGPIPSTNVEVNGEMMQVTARYFWMTGDRQYLDRAVRIADYYLLGDQHPTRNSDSLRLRDHGCELISGLTEVYFACSHADPRKAEQYRGPLHEILDCILDRGTDENGMMVNAFNPQTGEVTRGGLSDNWGYNYNGFYTVYLVDGTTGYRDAVRRVLSNLDQYRGYAWEGRSHDGYADSIESAINLYNREPVDVAADWIDSQMRIMLAMQQEDGIVGGWHGDGNFARTAIMYALWKQQGATVQPWRADLRLGAVQEDGQLRLLLAADGPWQGRLIFDAPRHETVLKMPQDYPRINQFPEWYTVSAADTYQVAIEGSTATACSGAELLAGLPLEIRSPDAPLQITVRRTN